MRNEYAANLAMTQAARTIRRDNPATLAALHRARRELQRRSRAQARRSVLFFCAIGCLVATVAACH